MKIQELANKYVSDYEAYRAKTHELQVRIATVEERLRQLKAELNEIHCPNWIESIIHPIAKELGEHFPDYNTKILGPFGICAEVPIHFYRKGIPERELWAGGNVKSITLIPGDLDKGEILIRDTSVDTGKYKPGTIGELNGMNHPSIEIPEDAEVSCLLQWIR